MDASSIPYKLSLCADRAHACAGDSYVSSAIDVACTTTQRVIAIASPHELHGDSWPSSPTGTSSFCCNQQYSVTAVTTSTGSIAERYAYTAYGQPTILDASASVLSSSAINNRYSYTGREWDATLGLHHFRARWMNPSAGRFLGRDPIGYEGSKWFLYEFLRSKSLKGIDPSGLICQEDRKPPEHCCPLAFEETPDMAECFNNPSPISRDKGCKYKDSTCFAIRDKNGNPQSWPISCVCKHKIWADNDPTNDCIRGCLQCVHDKSGKTPGMELHEKCIFECVNRHNSDDWLGLYPTRAIVRLMIFTMLVQAIEDCVGQHSTNGGSYPGSTWPPTAIDCKDKKLIDHEPKRFKR
jgi:RHS repeat-associated protein